MPIFQPLRGGTAHSLRRFYTSFAIFTLFLGLVSCTGDSETETPEGCNAVCAQRECGIDTTCQVDCGGCSTGTCSDAGECVEDAEPGCGNGILEPGELCDGSETGNSTCESQGFAGGTLGCNATCDGFDTSSCSNQSCTPDCVGLECGPDPVCGQSCGTCAPGTCQSGSCVEASSDGPTIVQFASNRTVLTEDGSLLLSAIVTDPQGVDDVIGGTLESPTGAVYASFATSASEGSYSATLTWSLINQVDTIQFATSDEIVLVAKFFDQAANATSATLTITLECSEAGESACDATCIDLETNLDNCGACERACTENGTCSAGECACTTNDQCLLGTICRNEICVPGCRDNSECDAGSFCDEGTCRSGCQDDASCAAEEICDLATRSCRSGCNLSTVAGANEHWIGSFNVDFADLYFLQEIETYGNYLYVSEGENLVAIVNASNPNAPTYAGTLEPSWYLDGLKVVGSGLWGRGNNNVYRYSLSDPTSPSLAYAIYTGSSWSSPKAAGFAINDNGVLAVAKYQDETTHYSWKLEVYDTTASQATLRWSYDLPDTSSFETVDLTINAGEVVLYREDQTILWSFALNSGALNGSPQLTETPRLMALTSAGLYLESSVDNGFYSTAQGSLTKTAELPSAYTYSLVPHDNWLLRSVGSSGLQLVNVEDPVAPFVQATLDFDQTIKDVALGNGGIWIAEQPETLRRATIPACFSN